MADNDKVLIIDCGSLFTKYGVSDTLPSNKSEDPFLLPSTFINSSGSYQLVSPTQVISDTGFYSTEYEFPLREGRILNFDLYFKLLQQIINQYVNQPSISNIVLTEQEILFPREREMLTEIMFEQFTFSNVFLARKAACAIYECQDRYFDLDKEKKEEKLTGIVLHSGDSYTSATPVYNGYTMVLPNNREPALMEIYNMKESYNIMDFNEDINIYQKSTLVPVGGLNLLYPLISKLNKSQGNPSKPINFTKYLESSQSDSNIPSIDFLDFDPDENINISNSSSLTKDDIIQVMFKRENKPKQQWKKCNVVDMIKNSIEDIDLELQKKLLSNIVLSGGNTSRIGFSQKLLKELKAEYEKYEDYSDVEIKVRESEKISNFTIWSGAEKMVKKDDFKHRWASREEYMENGPIIGEMKFF